MQNGSGSILRQKVLKLHSVDAFIDRQLYILSLLTNYLWECVVTMAVCMITHSCMHVAVCSSRSFHNNSWIFWITCNLLINYALIPMYGAALTPPFTIMVKVQIGVRKTTVYFHFTVCRHPVHNAGVGHTAHREIPASSRIQFSWSASVDITPFLALHYCI